MNEYTPTTEQAKQAYITGMRQAFIRSAGEHGAEFDRWFAEVERAAAEKAWTAGARSAEQFYQSRNPAYRKTPLTMPGQPVPTKRRRAQQHDS